MKLWQKILSQQSQTERKQGKRVIIADRPMDKHVTNTLVIIAVLYTICFTPLCLYNGAHLIKVITLLLIVNKNCQFLMHFNALIDALWFRLTELLYWFDVISRTHVGKNILISRRSVAFNYIYRIMKDDEL